MKIRRIAYSNFWGNDRGFTAGYFYRLFPFLRSEYDIQVTPHADYVFYSVYGFIKNMAKYATRILISGEAGDHFKEGAKIAPGEYDTNFFHYGLTCAHDNHNYNHMFLPQPLIMLNLHNNGWKSLIRNSNLTPKKEYFCDFIYGNSYSPDRIVFCKKLMEYKRVECAGPVLRNTNALHGLAAYSTDGYHAKQAFQAKCKFSIAFENNYFNGYTTEKLSDPLVARSVPIYFGNPLVYKMFNPKSYINVRNFNTFDGAIDYIKEVDQNDNLYEYHLNAPPFKDNVVPYRYSDEAYLTFFRRIFG